MGDTALINSVAGGIVAIVTVVLGYLFGRRKSQADTESVNVKTSLELVGSLREEIGELKAQVKENAQELKVLRRRERIAAKLLRDHERWDEHAVTAMRLAGIPIADAPPLNIDDAPDPHGVRTRADDRRHEP